MAVHRSWLLVSFFLLEFLLLEAAKILTISTLGGSHYIVMSRVSQILHGSGHNVTKLLHEMVHIPDFRKEKPSYQVLNWHLPEDLQKKFDNRMHLLTEELSYGSICFIYNHPVVLDLENFISQFGDSGFVLVALGSIVSVYQTKEVIKEMNSAFGHLPQGVLWTCKDSLWPKDVRLAPNVKTMDWLPQTDLLAHPSIRLFVTHGGMNSVNEAIQNGVPMVGIPFFADQPENMVRVEAKKIGVSIQMQKLKAETFALTMKEVIENKRYKSAAMASKIIRQSHPLTPAQRLVGWIDHILQTGGAAHLKPHVFQQPWYEQYLLDVLLLLLGLTLGTSWLCVKVLGAVVRYLSGVRKVKQT
ncbi:LOW QUALITY PROTEIN: UDP-glucuronosyltransferase 3A2-like [Grammomys surdaster]|uniref:LOW QUALITY PROTEIN: UDP-glucuronosyltransferase 3A2-like n=1 Tax=Grammomys surdaster TaxID=491861 RepID=UPI0010A0AB32|nr:LOW QUALITY PROTEIN: UDP-glucuronosyltransferase 3A2-like [Grammomys surdaster]